MALLPKGRVQKKCKCGLRPFRGGGGFTETTPLIVKYIHKGNIHDFVEKQRLKEFAIRRPHSSMGGVSKVWSRTTLLHFILDPFLNMNSHMTDVDMYLWNSRERTSP